MKIENNRICIIGYSGQLGSEIQSILSTKTKNILLINSKNSKNYSLNILKSKISKFSPSIIINCSAFTDVNQALEKVKICMHLNFSLVNKLIEISNLTRSILIHFSSDFVFDGKKKAYDENCAPSPLNFYGYSKAMSDKLISQDCKRYIIVRTSWIYSNEKNNFVKKICLKILKKENLFVTNQEFGSPTSAKYLSELVLKLLTSLKTKNLREIFNISSSGYCSRYTLATEILNQMKKKYDNFYDLSINNNTNFKSNIIRPTKPILVKDKYISLTRQVPHNWKKDLFNNFDF